MDFAAIVKKRNRNLHSKEHLLADDLARAMAEPKKFAAYLGIAELYRESDLRALVKNVLQKKDLPVESRGKYFFASLRKLPKKSKVKNLNPHAGNTNAIN